MSASVSGSENGSLIISTLDLLTDLCTLALEQAHRRFNVHSLPLLRLSFRQATTHIAPSHGRVCKVVRIESLPRANYRLRQWSEFALLRVEGWHLFLSLIADGATYEFALLAARKQ